MFLLSFSRQSSLPYLSLLIALLLSVVILYSLRNLSSRKNLILAIHLLSLAFIAAMAEVSNLLKRIDLLGKSMQEDSFENLEARRRELKTAVRKLGVALETPGETVDRFVYQVCGKTPSI